MAAKRIYEVVNKENDKSRLVRATSRAQAIGHVARHLFVVAVPDQETLVNLVSNGTKVEDASAE